jgi:hypothetical protein
MDALPEDRKYHIEIIDIAAQALAEAMAWRLDPLNGLPPTDDMVKRASQVVSAITDLAGRPFVVLVCGSERDAARLAEACGKNGDHIGEALRVLDRLAEVEEALP